jgi:protoporphyrinogen oxidase
MNGGISLWFAADAAPLAGPWLLLNGDGRGRVNHVAVMSEVSSAYAPAGKSLICVNLVGQAEEADECLIDLTRTELSGWFGAQTSAWSPLRLQRLPDSLPAFVPPTPTKLSPARPTEAGFWSCGDHHKHPSLEGAASSGVETAQAILQSPN